MKYNMEKIPMKKLQVAYSKKEKAEKLLSNLEKLWEEEAITEEQYQTLKSEYEKVREDAISEVEQIKSRIKDKLKGLEKQLGTLKRDLSSFEARFKVGELSDENYSKVKRKIQAKIEKTGKRISHLETLINSKSSEEVGGYIDVEIMERQRRKFVFPTIIDIFKFSAIKTKITSLVHKPKFRTASIIGVISLVVIAVCVLLLPSLGKNSPSKTMKLYVKAVIEGNVSEFESYLSSKSLRLLKKEFGNIKDAMESLKREIKGLKKIKVLKEDIHNEKSTVRFKLFFKDGKTEEDKIRLIKENEIWKIDYLVQY